MEPVSSFSSRVFGDTIKKILGRHSETKIMNIKLEGKVIILDSTTYSNGDPQVISSIQSHLEWSHLAHFHLLIILATKYIRNFITMVRTTTWN
jgi:hypothetical protein